MRLRSSQFVFLMLLLCSVQLREDCTLHLLTTAVTADRAAASSRQAHLTQASPSPAQLRTDASSPARPAPAPHQPHPPSGPVRNAMAVNSFTGLLRA